MPCSPKKHLQVKCFVCETKPSDKLTGKGDKVCSCLLKSWNGGYQKLQVNTKYLGYEKVCPIQYH